jgi:SAM-dependent methyltransferase
MILPDVVLRALLAARHEAPSHLPRSKFNSVAETTSAAKAKGLSVSQYVAQLWDEVGLVEANMARFEAAGAFCKKGGRVVEIGPGTGRYLEQVLNRAIPSEYQIYEIADDWRNWLGGTYPSITVCQTDGRSLAETGTRTADLILSFGVFVYLPLTTSLRYFREIHRAAAPGSFVIFDIISEKTIEGRLLDQWIASGLNYPTFLSSEYVEEVFEGAGFSLVDSFTSKFGPAVSEFLIFWNGDKRAPAAPFTHSPAA